MNIFTQYLKNLEKELQTRKAGEHSYRPAFKELIEGLLSGVQAVNEPSRIACGAPDFIVLKDTIPIGYIEAKEIGIPLDPIEKSDQLKRYRDGLNNLILTNYLEFRWFIDGEKVISATIGEIDNKGNIIKNTKGVEEVDSLINSFLTADIPIIADSKELAKRMASIAKIIREAISLALKNEKDKSQLYNQLEGFREVLIHDLQEDDFADMYAQTISYGLFAARCNHDSAERFERNHADQYLPETNPFLRKLFHEIAGFDLDQRIAWAVDTLAELLNKADMHAILADFGTRTRREDPVVHFYETFLSAYNPKLREMRGVYYTPEPVVSYIVRSIDHILKKDFGLKDGLADYSKIKVKIAEGEEQEFHKVLILDPAVGTGTFLHGVIDHIYDSFKNKKGMWSSYVSQNLLPRLFGFELLMAPYAVAHMKLGLQLKELGYEFDTGERLGIYLTNTLEEKFEGGRFPFMQWVANEANEAGRIKSDYPVMVVLGNPPYSEHSANKGDWITKLLRGKDIQSGEKTSSYFHVNGDPLKERNSKTLNNDYVKFIRFAQRRIEKTGCGVLAFISNHGYLDNPTFRGMRKTLLNEFDDIYILDLHGNARVSHGCPPGIKDENVFDIRPGVAIGIFVKNNGDAKRKIKVHFKEMFGQRKRKEKKNNSQTNGKFAFLLNNSLSEIDWEIITPESPLFQFRPYDTYRYEEYENGVKIIDLFRYYSMGITTGRNTFATSYSKKELENRIQHLASSVSDDTIRSKYSLYDSSSFDLGKARKWAKYPNSQSSILLADYRCFDKKHLIFSKHIISRTRESINIHQIDHSNVSLTTLRRVREDYWKHAFVANIPITKEYISSLDNNYSFPLYLYPNPDKNDLFDNGTEATDAPGGRKPNLSPEFIKEFSDKLEWKFVADGKGDLKLNFGPEDIFYYIYAIFHSPAYRERYTEFLKIDFPRVPLTSDKELFRSLAVLGERLVKLHLVKEYSDKLPGYPIEGSDNVDKIRYTEPGQGSDTGRVWINETQYFDGVPAEVYNFMIGGYQVCHKWLKDRKGRKLDFNDMDHYRRIVGAITDTIVVMGEIDEVIDSHGGWPIE